MLEVLESLERVAVRLSPIVLVLPGLALAALGLFVWLGGLGFRRPLMGLVGILTGGLLGYGLAGRHLLATVSSAVSLTFVATIFQRFFAAALLAVLAGTAVFLMLAEPAPHVRETTEAEVGNQTGAEARLSVRESLELVESHWLDLTTKVRHAAAQLGILSWVIVAGVGLGLLAFGFVSRRLGDAISCAAAGASLVFAGLVLLLMFKGAGPVTRIEGRPAFYGLVFGSMVGFGTLEQLLLCPRDESTRQAESKTDKARPTETKRRWRTR